MPQRNHLQIRRIGHIQGRHNLANALQVIGIVRDNQGVVARIDVDGVIGADQGSKYRHQIVGAFMIQAENLGQDLVAANLYFPCRHRTALQFGLSLRHDFVNSTGLNHREALEPERSQKLSVRHRDRNWALGGEVHLPFHPRINDDVAVHDDAESFCHFRDFGIHKIEFDALRISGCTNRCGRRSRFLRRCDMGHLAPRQDCKHTHRCNTQGPKERGQPEGKRA